MLYDLSLSLSNKIPSFPGTPEAKIEQLANIEKDGWNSKRISFNSHYSTHIDAPSHMIKDGKTLDDYPVEKFIGDAIVLDASNMNEIDTPIDNVMKGDIVFLFTGQSDKIFDRNYFTESPVLTKSFAEKLIGKGISILGLDAPSPDDTPYEIHHLLLGHDILIVENLTNLHNLRGRRFKCIIAPLKIENADGAPCRVFAEV